MTCSGPHCGQRIGNRTVRIIVTMNAHNGLWERLADFLGDSEHLVRQGAAVGFTQDQCTGPGVSGRLQHFHGVFRIGFVTVEKVFGVKDHFPSVFDKISHRVCAQLDIFVQAASQNIRNVHIPGLSDQSDDLSSTGHQCADTGIILDSVAGPAGTAESGDFGMFKIDIFDSGKELFFFGITERETAFNVIDLEFVQTLSDLQFVFSRKTHAFSLHPVSQCRIVYFDFFHIIISLLRL